MPPLHLVPSFGKIVLKLLFGIYLMVTLIVSYLDHVHVSNFENQNVFIVFYIGAHQPSDCHDVRYLSTNSSPVR